MNLKLLAKRTAGVGALFSLVLGLSLTSPMPAFSHGDVAPQPVDIKGLKEIGKEWLEKNPYETSNKRAVEIGCTAYNQNCARCHGLGVVSGGVAPDLRYLEKDDDGDAWFISRIRKGYHQNGITKMPGFEGLMPQEAMWAIRTYINIRPEEDADAAKPGTGGNCQKINWDLLIKKKSGSVTETVKEKAVAAASTAKEKAAAAAETVKEKTAAATEVAKEKTAAAAKVAKEKAAQAKEKASELANSAKEKSTELAKAAKEKIKQSSEKGWIASIISTVKGWFGWAEAS